MALTLVLVAGFILRLDGLAFGFPALLDPDEPIFILTALRLLREHTLNPGWFGHPGTTTIYVLAVIEFATFSVWTALGRFADAHSFGLAIYADPALIFLPGRIFILVCGMLTIVLTYVISRRLFDSRVALVAALLLAIDPLHIRYSQIIRTDMQATIFVLLEILSAISILKYGRRRDYVVAAIVLGFACATKWPAAACSVAVGAVAAMRLYRGLDALEAALGKLALYAICAVGALFVASPYLFLDVPTVIANLHGEERPFHLGATGYGLFGNMGWYVGGPLVFAFGFAGLLLGAVGCWIGSRRSTAFGVTVLPVAALFFVMISAQALVWERWLIPMLPVLSMAAAVALVTLLREAAGRFSGMWRIAVQTTIIMMVCVPVLLNARAASAERASDTRLLATHWALTHIPSGSTVTIEHGAFDILGQPWHILFPMGDRGCISVRAALGGQIKYSSVDNARAGKPVVDIGTVDPAQLTSCHSDWAITVNWDRYRAEPEHFTAELENYRRLTAGGRIAATFRPWPGHIGGPVVRVVRLAPH